jgi:outer membrane protein OmpA-like peptidoglycan-associated protein
MTGASVDATGCEKDSDGDGVVDRLDLCPNSTQGSTVNKLGCEQNANIILEDISFALGTAKLTDNAKQNLAAIAKTLAQSPEMKLEVAGYTDNIGNKDRNQKLSERRAQAVMNYLVEQGVSEGQLTAKGYGVADPIVDNGTAEGRARNRRVELHRIN